MDLYKVAFKSPQLDHIAATGLPPGTITQVTRSFQDDALCQVRPLQTVLHSLLLGNSPRAQPIASQAWLGRSGSTPAGAKLAGSNRSHHHALGEKNVHE